MGLHLAGDEVGFYPGVIVDTITPPYTTGTEVEKLYSYTLIGRGFDNIPNDAIGIMSTENDNPTAHLNAETSDYDFELTLKSSYSMTFERTARYLPNSYLGCIASADRSIVYWVNDTRPIP